MIPGKVAFTTETPLSGVDFAPAAILVPESTGHLHRAVTCWMRVVIAVVCAEHHAVLVINCIVAGVTRVPSYMQRVVVCLGQDSERAVLGVVPVAVVPRLQVEPELVAAGQSQLTEQIVAEPVVAAGVVETDLELHPRTIEEN